MVKVSPFLYLSKAHRLAYRMVTAISECGAQGHAYIFYKVD